MSDSFLISLVVLSVFFAALLIVPLFVASERLHRGLIFGIELGIVFSGWFKIRDATLLGQIPWWPREVEYFKTFLVVVMAVTALFFLFQFIPYKKSATSDDSSQEHESKAARSGE